MKRLAAIVSMAALGDCAVVPPTPSRCDLDERFYRARTRAFSKRNAT
jgi:hypothetical protein